MTTFEMRYEASMLYDEQTVPEQLESRPCGDIQCSALRIHVLIPVQYLAVSRITGLTGHRSVSYSE